jgi:hypothetical protein
MSPRARLTVITVLALLVVVAPMALIALGADRGSASFGDTEQLGVNRLASATVDIAVRPATAALLAENLAPGDTVAGEVELTNAGTIPLHYAVRLEGSVDAELVPWLTWSFTLRDAGQPCPEGAAWHDVPASDRTDLPAATLVAGAMNLTGDPAPGLDPGDRILDVGAVERLCVAANLPVGVPNDAQAASARLVVRVDAEQLVTEEQS